MSVTPGKIVATYDRGLMTRREMVDRLVSAAVEYPPEAMVDLLPSWCVDELRRIANTRPTPDKIIVIRGGIQIPRPTAAEAAAQRAELARQHCDGAARWLAYFEREAIEHP
jgi:hypothetical protein